MKKETEVLQAAECGNVAKLESLFEQRQAKVFAGFFKGPNINWRNENGCTALHLAALNGHTEAVIFLLHNDASANTPDNAGSFPLHLAAFNGHSEVARILIERGPSKARVNEANMTGDTALHVAAQYNHHTVMDVLLKHHADIFLRNIKEESALDLAAQYGRFNAVQMLVFKDLGILKEAVHRHSPLHLAARNGHVDVVSLLLDSGMPLNAVCDMGTALHTAAMYGKVEVAKLLLKRGINIEIENGNNEKVLDLLCKIPSKVSQEITALIYENSGLISTTNERTLSLPCQRQRPDSMPSGRVTKLTSYDYVTSFRKCDEPVVSDGVYPYAKIEGLGKNADRLSNYDGFGLASVTGKKENDSHYISSGELHTPYSLVDIRSQSMIGNYKQLDYNQNPRNPKQNNIELKDNDDDDDYLQVDTVFTYNSNEQVPSQPPIVDLPPPSPNTASLVVSDIIRSSTFTRKNENENELNKSNDLDAKQQAMLTDAANNLLGVKSLCKSVPVNIGMNSRFNQVTDHNSESTYPSTYDNVALKNTPVSPNLGSYDNVNLCPTVNAFSAPCYDNVNLTHGQARNNYDNVHLKNIPVSTNNINSNSNKEKSVKQRKTLVTRDIPLGEDSLSSKDNKEINVYDEMAAPGEDNPIPKPRTKVKQSRTSLRNVSQGYRMSEVANKETLDVSYEWNKIDKFVSELELYAEEPSPTDISHKYENVWAWLNSIGLVQYEPMFVTNGFDDTAFLNGVITDQDLIQFGILHSEHRKHILDCSLALRKCPVFGKDGFPFPNDVKEWLAKLKLPEYERRFIYYGYDNMERVRVIWELELVTVLEITTIGHYKRMLCSLGKQQFENKSWSPKSVDAVSTKTSLTLDDDSMDVAKQLWETAESLKIERKQRQSISEKNDVKSSATVMGQNDLLEKSKTSSEQNENLPPCEWIHSSATLLTGSVSYVLQYLGSHPVHEVKGVESTLDACTKMKKISRNIQKVPSVTLSISVRGIDYVDTNSKMIINQYAINNISYCAQDTVEFNIFAYITRDECTRKHYCHVFKVKSIELADEIIITIGQCFELAYQIHLDTINNRNTNPLQRCMSIVSDTPGKVPDVQRAMTSPNQTNSKQFSNKASPRIPPRPPKPYSGKISTDENSERDKT